MDVRSTSISLASIGLALAGCAAGEGTVRVTAYGESFIEDGIPAEGMNDGWAVAFERFDVFVADVRVAGAAIEVPASIDLAEGSGGVGHELGSAVVSEGTYGNASFVIDRVEVDGAAMLGAETKTFSWAFELATAHQACEARTSVSNGGVGTFQITIHADHLFYDSLVAEEPEVVFQPLADADGDGDGVLTQAELAATDIGSHDPGSEGDVENLWDWLVAATRTIGHADGEGHCETAPAIVD